eukprot:m.155243 g.155243  ORF g.155243 m.155243 type:complete len:190 (-) comp11720_c1_seq3:1948-2517(-)
MKYMSTNTNKCPVCDKVFKHHSGIRTHVIQVMDSADPQKLGPAHKDYFEQQGWSVGKGHKRRQSDDRPRTEKEELLENLRIDYMEGAISKEEYDDSVTIINSRFKETEKKRDPATLDLGKILSGDEDYLKYCLKCHDNFRYVCWLFNTLKTVDEKIKTGSAVLKTFRFLFKNQLYLSYERTGLFITLVP